MIVITFYVSVMNTLILFFLEQVNQQRTCSFGKKRSASGQSPSPDPAGFPPLNMSPDDVNCIAIG
jgi:hypothetical protein